MQTQEATVDQSKMQQLVGLLEKSAEAWGRAGADTPDGAEYKLYSYMNYIQRQATKGMPDEERWSAISDAWESLNPDCDLWRVSDIVYLSNPRLPQKVRAELARRVQASEVARAAARPTYDAIIEFLGLGWAFEDRQPGCCADPMDKEFLESPDLDSDDYRLLVIGEYEEPFDTVDLSIAMGPASAEQARELIALARAVNAARAEYRDGRQVATGASAQLGFEMEGQDNAHREG